MRGWPSNGRMRSVTMRAKVSTGPPPENGTVSAIGWVGYFCAVALSTNDKYLRDDN
jgi:hypothetical protein